MDRPEQPMTAGKQKTGGADGKNPDTVVALAARFPASPDGLKPTGFRAFCGLVSANETLYA